MTDITGPGSLKLISGSSPNRSLRDVLGQALLARSGENDMRHLHGDTFLVHTEAEPAAIRDWLAPLLSDGESLFVVEFERWSGSRNGHGQWLLRRGH